MRSRAVTVQVGAILPQQCVIILGNKTIAMNLQYLEVLEIIGFAVKQTEIV